MNNEPIQRRKLYQEVEQRLLDRIRSGKSADGEPLTRTSALDRR